MGTEKRERQKANRALKHQQEQQAASRRKLYRKIAIGVAGVAALVLFVWIASTVVGDDDEPSTPSPRSRSRQRSTTIRSTPFRRRRTTGGLIRMITPRLVATLAVRRTARGRLRERRLLVRVRHHRVRGHRVSGHRAPRPTRHEADDDARPRTECPPIEGADCADARVRRGTADVPRRPGPRTRRSSPPTRASSPSPSIPNRLRSRRTTSCSWRATSTSTTPCAIASSRTSWCSAAIRRRPAPAAPATRSSTSRRRRAQYQIGSIAMAKTVEPDSAGQPVLHRHRRRRRRAPARVRTVRPGDRRPRHHRRRDGRRGLARRVADGTDRDPVDPHRRGLTVPLARTTTCLR